MLRIIYRGEGIGAIYPFLISCRLFDPTFKNHVYVIVKDVKCYFLLINVNKLVTNNFLTI